MPFNLFRRKQEEPEEKPEQPAAAGDPDAAEPEEEQTEEPSLFGRLKSGLRKTRRKVAGGLRSVLSMHRSLDEEVLDEVEEQLYLADVGPRSVMEMCEALREAYKKGELESSEQVLDFLKRQMKAELESWDTDLHLSTDRPAVVMVAGVNGSGKTTSIAKLAHRFQNADRRVLLAASDTFRAAAVEQLAVWAERIGVDIVKNESADPAAVAFDAAEKATAGDYDVLIIDTAGRLHTRRNLMRELLKIHRVVGKKIPGAPDETLMVLDATTGQNAISQAIRFHESIGLTGIVLAKLDGTAKGGVIFGIKDQVDLPVKFVGIGEQVEDLVRFDGDRFVDALFE
ncbi:MAG: signal recognition particle-docking protein FtsY [Planctomycetota bacterium]